MVTICIHPLDTNDRLRRCPHFHHLLDSVVRPLALDARKRFLLWKWVLSLALKGQGGMPLVWSVGERTRGEEDEINHSQDVVKGWILLRSEIRRGAYGAENVL